MTCYCCAVEIFCLKKTAIKFLKMLLCRHVDALIQSQKQMHSKPKHPIDLRCGGLAVPSMKALMPKKRQIS